MKFKKICIYILLVSLFISTFVSISFAENASIDKWGVASWYCQKDEQILNVDNEKIISDLKQKCNEEWGTESDSQWKDYQYEKFANIVDEAIAEANLKADNNKYNITVAFCMPEDSAYLYDYVSNCNPYVYIQKYGQFYSRTPLVLGNYKEKYATACLSIEGIGEYEGMICHNEADGIPTAQSENFGTFSTISLSIYQGGIKCKYTNKMNSDMADEINNYEKNVLTSNVFELKQIKFEDVIEGKWYYDSVISAAEMGLIKGSGSYFYPKENLSYIEAVTMAARINATYKGLDPLLTFDANCSPWYKTYKEYAENNSIPCNNYTDMNGKITREEFVHILYSALPKSEYKTINEVKDGFIPDVPMTHKYSKEIYTLYKAGIISGSDEYRNFNPKTNIKRCEVATILCRMMGEGRQKF